MKLPNSHHLLRLVLLALCLALSMGAAAKKTTIKVTNNTIYPLHVVFKAVGCAHIYHSDVNKVMEGCAEKDVALGETVSYEYGAGTSGRTVWLGYQTATAGMLQWAYGDPVTIWQDQYVGRSGFVLDAPDGKDSLTDEGQDSCALKGTDFGITDDAHIYWYHFHVEYNTLGYNPVFQAFCLWSPAPPPPGARPAADAIHFTSLHPAGAAASEALAVSDGQQVGTVFYAPPSNGMADSGKAWFESPQASPAARAALWHGTAGSLIVLNPTVASTAEAVAHGVQGGAISDFATLWAGNSEQPTMLPTDAFAGYTGGHIRGISNGWQVGIAGFVPPGTEDGTTRAVMWHAAAHPDALPTPLHFGEATDKSVVWAIQGATATSPGQQVGAAGPDSASLHAILWNGSATDHVDLHPDGATSSQAYAMSGNRQVGYVITPDGRYNAVMWQGTAASVVNLNPPGMEESLAWSIYDHWVVGDMYPPGGDINDRRAVLWNLDNIGTPIDLSAFLPDHYSFGRAQGIDGDAKGNLWIAGTAWNTDEKRLEAVTWQYDAVAARTCSGGAVLPGTYPTLTIQGNCIIDSAVTVLGALTIASGGNLDATYKHTQLAVKGNVVVGTGGGLALGCSNGHADCGTAASRIGAITVDGNLVALSPSALALNFVTVRGNVGVYGGTAATLPVQDNAITGNLVVNGWNGTVVSVLRNKVSGSMTVSNNVGANVDSNDVASNSVGGNLVCRGNAPTAHVGTGGNPNAVGGLKSGECAGL